jgi:hypothetical protein
MAYELDTKSGTWEISISPPASEIKAGKASDSKALFRETATGFELIRILEGRAEDFEPRILAMAWEKMQAGRSCFHVEAKFISVLRPIRAV